MSLLESIGSDLEELGKRVQCFLLFSAGTVPEIGLLGEEGSRMRKQRMRNKRPWPFHVFTSFASSSINTLMSEALDLGKKKRERKYLLGRRNSHFYTQTTEEQCTSKSLTQTGGKQATGTRSNAWMLEHPVMLGARGLQRRRCAANRLGGWGAGWGNV